MIPEAKAYVKKQIELLNGKVSMRTSDAKDGFTISDHGHFIMEATFENVEDIKKLNYDLNNIPGIIDTSLFVGIATGALSVDGDNIRFIR